MTGKQPTGTLSPQMHEQELGTRLEQLRLSRNITQTDLARDAGISERTLRRLESGAGGTLDSLFRVLSALRLDGNLDLLIPNPDIRPIERVHTKGRERQRSSSSKTAKNGGSWQWGEKK